MRGARCAAARPCTVRGGQGAAASVARKLHDVCHRCYVHWCAPAVARVDRADQHFGAHVPRPSLVSRAGAAAAPAAAAAAAEAAEEGAATAAEGTGSDARSGVLALDVDRGAASAPRVHEGTDGSEEAAAQNAEAHLLQALERMADGPPRCAACASVPAHAASCAPSDSMCG